ncbi:MAG: hypothetical protein D6767_06540, partial [Candidatus Hydrogenedentota bacterium]
MSEYSKNRILAYLSVFFILVTIILYPFTHRDTIYYYFIIGITLIMSLTNIIMFRFRAFTRMPSMQTVIGSFVCILVMIAERQENPSILLWSYLFPLLSAYLVIGRIATTINIIIVLAVSLDVWFFHPVLTTQEKAFVYRYLGSYIIVFAAAVGLSKVYR